MYQIYKAEMRSRPIDKCALHLRRADFADYLGEAKQLPEELLASPWLHNKEKRTSILLKHNGHTRTSVALFKVTPFRRSGIHIKFHQR